MSKPGSDNFTSALTLLESGLSYYMPRSSRYCAEDALYFLRSGRVESGYEALADAIPEAGGLAYQFLVQARDLLAPERCASA